MKKPLVKKWEVFPRLPKDVDAQLAEFPPIFRQVLFNRGIENMDQADRFLHASDGLHDPYLMKDMPIAVDRIKNAVREGKTILVFGDYDADGLTATALLVQALGTLGARVDKYIPNRFEEGYGFSMNALEGVLQQKPDMLITVDCGVRSMEEVALAKQHGIEVIITDHHLPHRNKMPDAAAIICSKQPGDEYPYAHLAGVGIAYKLVQALQMSCPEIGLDADRWLELVAIGTVADMAPLTDENRVLVKRGIERIRLGEHAGISALAAVSKIGNLSSFNAGHIGFMIGPRLNAAGRVSTAEAAYHLLMAGNESEATALAQKLNQDNQARQAATKKIFTIVEEHFLERDEKWLLFYAHEEFNEGIVGLAASKLAERYYRPAIVGARSGETIRASCRSINELDITRALDQCADLLEKHGGHAMAAGLTIRTENVEEFENRLKTVIAEELAGKELMPVLKADMEVGLSNLNPVLIPLLERLDPCGEQNPSPLFISRNVEVRSIQTMGNADDHLRLDVRSQIDEHNSQKITYSGVGFNLGWMAERLQTGSLIDILYSFGLDEYNGRKTPRLIIRDIKPII